MAEFGNSDFSSDSPEERINSEAEELMRQGRFSDAASRYDDLRRFSPSDLWVSLGQASALECAGKVREAEVIIDEATGPHRTNVHLHRFRRMFFERREDHKRARLCREVLEEHPDLDDESPDQLGELFFNQGRYNEALTEFNRILEEERLDDDQMRASVQSRYGACLRQAGRLEEARELLLASLGVDRDNHWTLAELAETERSLGNVDTARRHYQSALEANPKDHWCRGHLAQLEHEQGRTEVAISLYEHILEHDSRAIWARVELAQILGPEHKNRAEALCREALEQDPAYPWAWAHLGLLARQNNDFETARNHLRSALSHSPNSIWILHELADTCRQMDRLQEAHTHLEHAQNINPFDATTYGYRADLLRTEDRSAEALAYLRKAVELDPAYTWAWREIAELQALAKRIDEAEQAYAEAERLEPGEAINDGLKAFILRCADKRPDALPYLMRAVAVQPDYLWAWRELIEYMMSTGDLQGAKDRSAAACQAIKGNPQLLALRAEVLRQAGEREEARQVTDEALALDERVPQLWALSAELHADRDPRQALDKAWKAVRLDNQPEYRLLVVQLLMATGDLQTADREIQHLLQHQRCPVPSWSLAAEIADRSDEGERARALLRQGRERHPDDLRLLIHQVRLRVNDGDLQAAADLAPTLDARESLPWREIAQLSSQASLSAQARQACDRLLQESAPGSQERSQHLTFAAEVELMLEDTSAARQLLDQALDIDADNLSACLLAAMLAERQGDSQQAEAHLEHLVSSERYQQLADKERAGYLRQMAQIREHQQAFDKATALWDEAIERGSDQADIQADHARFLLRHNRADDAAATFAALLEDQAQDIDRQQVIQDMTQAQYSIGGEAAALKHLEHHREELSTGNRMLLAQLLLSDTKDESRDKAEQVLESLLQEEGEHQRPTQLLLAQACLQRREPKNAEEIARQLWTEQASDEEAATILADALAMQNRWDDALTTLLHDELPERASAPRGLLTACLLLETRGVEATLVWLGGQSHLAHIDRPIIRCLRSAWPCWRPPENRLERSDISHLPAFPRMASSVAEALTTQGIGDLAVLLLMGTADALADRNMPGSRRELLRHASRLLLKQGRRGDALRVALTSRSLSAIGRCLLP